MGSGAVESPPCTPRHQLQLQHQRVGASIIIPRTTSATSALSRLVAKKGEYTRVSDDTDGFDVEENVVKTRSHVPTKMSGKAGRHIELTSSNPAPPVGSAAATSKNNYRALKDTNKDTNSSSSGNNRDRDRDRLGAAVVRNILLGESTHEL